MMPTADGEKPHLIISNNRMNEAVSYPFVHVIWMGTNLTRVRFAEHVVLGARDHPLVGFIDCSTLRRASKGHLARRFGAPDPRYHGPCRAGHPSRARLRAVNAPQGGPMERTVVADQVGLPPASIEDYNEMGRRITADEIAAVEAADLTFEVPED